MFGGQMHGYWGIGWLIGLLLFVAFVVGLVIFMIWVVRQTQKGSSVSQSSQQTSSAENILKERYARGEITRGEYLSMLEDIAG